MSPRASSLAPALVLILLASCSPKSPQTTKAPSAVAQAEQIAQEPGSGRPVAPPVQPESPAPEAAKSPAEQGGEAAPLPHLDPDHAVYWLLRHGTDSVSAAKAYCDVHRTSQERDTYYCGYRTHDECVAIKTGELKTVLRRDRGVTRDNIRPSFWLSKDHYVQIEGVASSCEREESLRDDFERSATSPGFESASYSHFDTIRQVLAAEVERCHAHNEKVLGALAKRSGNNAVLDFHRTDYPAKSDFGGVARVYAFKKGQKLRDLLRISKKIEKEWRQALSSGDPDYYQTEFVSERSLPHLDSPVLYGLEISGDLSLTTIDCRDEGCCGEGDNIMDAFFGETGEELHYNSMYPACPFVYTPDSREASGWRYRGEILRNLRHPSLETTQDLDLADPSLCDALAFRVRMTEEKEETSFVDAVWLRVGEALIAPSRCSRASQGEVCEDDGRYLVIERGEGVEFAFELTEGQRTACREGAVALVANGYYTPR